MYLLAAFGERTRGKLVCFEDSEAVADWDDIIGWIVDGVYFTPTLKSTEKYMTFVVGSL